MVRAKNAANSWRSEIEAAREALERAENRLVQHGSRPLPMIRTRSEKADDGGMYRGPTYRSVEYEDASNVRAWDEEAREYKEILNNRENELNGIIASARKDEGRVLSAEQAMRRYERKLLKAKANMEKAEKAFR